MSRSDVKLSTVRSSLDHVRRGPFSLMIHQRVNQSAGIAQRKKANRWVWRDRRPVEHRCDASRKRSAGPQPTAESEKVSRSALYGRRISLTRRRRGGPSDLEPAGGSGLGPPLTTSEGQPAPLISSDWSIPQRRGEDIFYSEASGGGGPL